MKIVIFENRSKELKSFLEGPSCEIVVKHLQTGGCFIFFMTCFSMNIWCVGYVFVSMKLHRLESRQWLPLSLKEAWKILQCA